MLNLERFYMKLLDKVTDILKSKLFLRYYLINLLLFVAFFGILLGRLIMKEGNPFFYSDF